MTWQPVQTEDGETYWWNTVTNETTWDEPIQQETTKNNATPAQEPPMVETEPIEQVNQPTEDTESKTESTQIQQKREKPEFNPALAFQTGNKDTKQENGNSHKQEEHDDDPAPPYPETEDINSKEYQDYYQWYLRKTAQHAREQKAPEGKDGDAYTVQATFNARTGKFQNVDSMLKPEDLTQQAKAMRQMSHYFNYDTWNEERNQAKAAEKAGGKNKKKVTKKDLEKILKRKEEVKRKKKAWLFED